MKHTSHDVGEWSELRFQEPEPGFQEPEPEIEEEAVYDQAVTIAVDYELREEWKKYLEDTERHHDILLGVFRDVELDPDAEAPARNIVEPFGKSLARAIDDAISARSARMQARRLAPAEVKSRRGAHRSRRSAR